METGICWKGSWQRASRFDVVVCGRVLCTIADKAEFDDALADLRRLVSDSGTVRWRCATRSTCPRNHGVVAEAAAAGVEYQDTFVYDKTVSASRNTRREVHRSDSTYRRAFVNAGFHIETVIELEGTNTGALLLPPTTWSSGSSQRQWTARGFRS